MVITLGQPVIMDTSVKPTKPAVILNCQEKPAKL